LYNAIGQQTYGYWGAVEVGEDGNKYKSWQMGHYGPVLGFHHPRNIPGTPIFMGNGSLGSSGHKLENRLAGMVCDIMPHVEAVWLSQTGGNACEAAVRIARAETGRNRVVSSGYHGMSSSFIRPPRDGGITYGTAEGTRYVPYRDSEELKRRLDSMAACWIVDLSMDDGTDDFLDWLRLGIDLCTKSSIPIILDEVVTGFRLGLRGAVEYYGKVGIDINPSMVVYGKAWGSPVSVLGGQIDFMQHLADDVYSSSTFSGDPFAVSIAIAFLENVTRFDSVFEKISKIGHSLKEGLQDLGFGTVGQDTNFSIRLPRDERKSFAKHMFDNGIIMWNRNYATDAHNKLDVKTTLEKVKTWEKK
jgi:glutamate-1-semialdehyde aminotransferase